TRVERTLVEHHSPHANAVGACVEGRPRLIGKISMYMQSIVAVTRVKHRRGAGVRKVATDSDFSGTHVKGTVVDKMLARSRELDVAVVNCVGNSALCDRERAVENEVDIREGFGAHPGKGQIVVGSLSRQGNGAVVFDRAAARCNERREVTGRKRRRLNLNGLVACSSG